MGFPLFFEVVTGISNAAYDDTKKFEFGFTSVEVQVNFQTGTGPIFYSFNGHEDHGVIGNPASGYIRERIYMTLRTNKIFLRGGDGTEYVHITALPA